MTNPNKVQLLVAALLLAQAPAEAQAPSGCALKEGVEEVFGSPVKIDRVAVGRPITLAPDAVLAVEVVQIATRMWRTDGPLRLPGSRSTYPAGVPVAGLRSHRGDERCVRDALPSGRGPNHGERVPCLLDLDADGRFETVEVFTMNALVPFVGTKPRFKPLKRATLDRPLTLTEDPSGIGDSRMWLHRRVKLKSGQGDIAEVVVEHAIQSAPALISYSLRGKGATPVPPNPAVFKAAGGSRAFRLVHGRTEQIGGMRFRIDRADSGWTLTPLDASFPDWLGYQCGGSRVAIQRIPL